MFTLVPSITIQDRTMLWKVNEFSLIYLPTCLTTYVSVIFCFLASSKLPHGSQAALVSGLVLNKETCSSFRIFALALQSVWNVLAPDTHLSILSSHSHFLSDVTSAERSSMTISSITALALPAASLLPLPPTLFSFTALTAKLSHIQLFVTPWTVACQVPLFMGFSRQEY